MKTKVLFISLIATVIMLFTILTGCDQIKSFLNGESNTSTGEAPTITGLETIKASADYLSSTEYQYNSQGTNPMALTFSETYYLVIHYKNESNLTISSVKVTWKDNGKGQSATKTFNKDSFAKGSDNTVTYIEFTTGDESQLTSDSTIDYIVNSVMYVNGSSTTRIPWSDGVSNSISVAIRPKFTLRLEYMNRDYRRGQESKRNLSGTGVNPEFQTFDDIYYKMDIGNLTVSLDYTGDTTFNFKKEGGWVFAGWYTEPFGKGQKIDGSSTYDFWYNMTFYAHYERMYDLEIVELEEPITHTYDSGGKDMEIEFTSGVIVKNRGKNSSDSVCSNYELDIPDTVVIEKNTVIEGVSNEGMPTYTVSVTPTEYPVVRIANNAFYKFNTILKGSIGKYVEEIGYYAFRECTKMKTLSFPLDSRLKYIGDFAFQKTEALGKTSPFTLPSQVEYLGMCAFRYSGWGITITESSGTAGESRLYIPATWKYIGYKCFANTGFERIVFRPGCHFVSQITNTEGSADESALGSETIRYGQNRIGAALFSQCYPLWSVTFDCDKNQENGLNIIPDYCFDAGSWEDDTDKKDGTFRCIEYIEFGEGLTFIGERAFNYQVKIPELALPKTLEEVGRYAFYNNTSVTNLNFEHVKQDTIDKVGVSKALTNDSRLKILKSYAFANLTGIDCVYITSPVYALYGNGVFMGCNRLKCIFFNNIQTIEVEENGKFVQKYAFPTGFKSSNAKFGYSAAKGDVIDDKEVLTGHQMSDFLYGTAESGEKEDANKDDFSMTYTNPVRIFCAGEYVDDFEADLLIGKQLSVGNTSSGTKSFNSQVFVHDINDLHEYTYTDRNKVQHTVQVAVQKIYKANNGKPSSNVLGYSVVYWSERSKEIVLPTKENFNLQSDIIEVAAYALPTSVRYLYVPDCYTYFEHDAFNSCSLLSEIEYEDINTLKYIGKYAFFGTAIRSFTGGTSLKVIGDYAFNRCLSLEWVDLSNCPIVNTFNDRMTQYERYKEKFELDDYDEDYLNCLGVSAFRGCTSLEWVYLPENIQQIRSSTFINCHSLTYLIIPTAHPSKETNTTSDDCFYEYGQPSTIFDPAYLHQIHFYVASTATDTHQKILEPRFIADGRYQLLDAAPNHK